MNALSFPAPWQLVGRDETGDPTTLETAACVQICYGEAPGVPCSIGGVPLTFRPRRSGSHRAGIAGRFSELDLAKLRVLAAAPQLLVAVANFVANVPIDPGNAKQLEARDGAIRALVDAGAGLHAVNT